MQIKEQGLVFFFGFPHHGPWWGKPKKNTSPFWAFANLQIKEQKKSAKKKHKSFLNTRSLICIFKMQIKERVFKKDLCFFWPFFFLVP